MAQNNQQGQQSQQSKQASMTGQGTQYTDRDLMQVALNECKLMTSSLNTYITEAANETLRRDYMTVLGDVYGQQKQLFELMQNKGYYEVKNASPQDITQAQNKFSNSQMNM